MSSEKHHDDKLAPIQIDRKQYKSPEDTTGNALYLLAGVGTDYDLYEEVHGPGHDRLIPNDGTALQVKPGTHFYTAKKNLNPGAN